MPLHAANYAQVLLYFFITTYLKLFYKKNLSGAQTERTNKAKLHLLNFRLCSNTVKQAVRTMTNNFL